MATDPAPETVPYNTDGEDCPACTQVGDLCRYHQGWVHGQQDAAPALEQARRIAVELENENARLTDELAEVKASHDPRLRCLILKAASDRDLYVGWSNTCDMPAGAWTRAEAIEYGFPPSRLNRADETGTSSKLGDGAWGDPGFVAEQRGWLKRDRLGDYTLAWLSGRKDQAFDLLEPFGGESEVRR